MPPRCKRPAAAPSSFHGVNWAASGDNYASGPVVPSGLSTSDSYATVYRITLHMVAGFRKNLGANTLRLPVNPASVGTTWWDSYRAAIDAATASGFKVILSYWDETPDNDGVIDNIGDSYSMETLEPDGQLVNNDPSGVAQLQWGYGFGSVPPVNDQPPAPPGEQIVGTASGRCVDVPGFSTTAGTQLDIWDCNGGGNQSWDYTSTDELSVYGDMCMQAGTTAVTAGAPVVIENCTGAADQQWAVNSSGTITSAADSAFCLEATSGGTADGTLLDVAACDGSASQAWTMG